MFECNNNHIAIIYGSQPCPLCVSHKAIKFLRDGIDEAFEYANGRWAEWGERAESVAEILEKTLDKTNEEWR
jgi:hypothetical protein